MGKTIRALLGFARLSDSDLVSRGRAILKGMTNHAILSNPPYTMPAFEAALDALANSIPAALDGSQKAIAEKNNNRKVVEKMVKLLAAYVEVVAGDDFAIFLSSGLEPASMVRISAQPMAPARIKKIAQGVSGQLLVLATGTKGAVHYEWRYAVEDAAGALGPWITEMAPSVRSTKAFDDLTPKNKYVFQVRALGKLGFSEWSASASRTVI